MEAQEVTTIEDEIREENSNHDQRSPNNNTTPDCASNLSSSNY